MELVRGIKITEYCDQNQLPTQERLRLFILVCQAIQHAHQKGIIHRDIKPSNILVTLHDGVPVPKVIDFGIAKATQQELTDKTVFTQFQQFIGTPAYMSPEQAEMSGLDIDTRADIYSLGVLLYELLVGQTPFDAKEMMQGGLDALRQDHPGEGTAAAFDQAEHVARRRPHHGGQTPADRRGQARAPTSGRPGLDRDEVPGEGPHAPLRNGQRAGGDLKRHLNNEPVIARPPNETTKFKKNGGRKNIFSPQEAPVLWLLIFEVGVGNGARDAGRA